MVVFEEKGITHLDLHGEKHEFVSEIAIDFVYRYQNCLPLIIICGNSNRMIEIVEESVHKRSIIFSMPRFGIIRIEKL